MRIAVATTGQRAMRARIGVDVKHAFYGVLFALFVWVECLDAPGLRSIARWWRSR